jgi:predicted HicB family RNase H-like nuclease
VKQPKAKKRKAGRPPLPNGQAKGRTVQVRFMPDDYRVVAAAAKASKKSLSEWVRGVLITSALDSTR